MEQVYNVIDSRYCKMLPLIVTTNLGLNEMKSTDLDTAISVFTVEYLKCVFPSIVVEKIREKKKGQKNSYRCRT